MDDKAEPKNVLHVSCSGSPREVGQQHGQTAAKQVRGSIQFYTQFFHETARLEWNAVGIEAEKWLPYLRKEWPEYVEEMEGLAEGAGVPFHDILALNVRTEISYGLMKPPGPSDGCTALAYHPESGASPFLAQNWDWEARQKDNIIRLTIRQASPRAGVLDFMTEAGIIGKIGLSSSGVGVCLNAIRAPGVAYDKLPVHLALRAALDADPRRLVDEHVNGHANGGNGGLASRIASILQRTGVASAAHILIADTDGAVGLETSCKDTIRVDPIQTTSGVLVAHTNHYIKPHAASDKGKQWTDSIPRLSRIEKLVRDSEAGTRDSDKVTYGLLDDWLRDEDGYPVSICRDQTKDSDVMTLFSIVMELREKSAIVRMGRPRAGAETFRLEAH